MAGGSHIPISVGYTPGRVHIKPTGACTVSICPGLKAYVRSFRKPEVTDIYFDLTEAGGVDSTFTGLLLSLATCKNDPARPAVHLLRPSPAVVTALSRMYVLSLFDVCQSAPDAPADWEELAPEKPAPEKTADVVIEAHEKLIDADPRNEPAFRPIVEGFRAEREKRTED